MQTDKPAANASQTPDETTEMAALKAELQQKLQSLKQCSYKEYECTQLSLEGYNYCLRHILQDRNAPFKACAYIYPNNGKHCHLPAPAPRDKKDNANLCAEHALRSHLANSKRNTRYQPPPTAEALLNKLSHYVKKLRPRSISSSTIYSEDGLEEEGKVTKCLDPFVDIDVKKQLASTSNVLEMCSESESDVEAASYSSLWHDSHVDTSEDESIDSEQEDVLKHANIYSAEEVTLITRDKLIRLQSLYIDQYQHLQYLLRERRRKYLLELKREKEAYCSIDSQLRDTPKEQRLFKKLKAYNSYHKKFGVEAICSKRLHERRTKISEIVTRATSHNKCIFIEGGVKCGEKSLPVAKYCRKHILQDTHQVLFRTCGKICGDIKCSTPIEELFEGATCRLHVDMPSLRSYSQPRKDSESDYEEVAEHSKVESKPTFANLLDLSQKNTSLLDVFQTPEKSSSSTETAISGYMSPLELKDETSDIPDNLPSNPSLDDIKVEDVDSDMETGDSFANYGIEPLNVEEEEEEGCAMETDANATSSPLLETQETVPLVETKESEEDTKLT